MMTATPSLVLPVTQRDHRQGRDNAPVQLVEYGDYECPYCGAAHPIVKDVQHDMGDELLFVFRNFPLTEIHPHAETAARLSEAGELQSKFWQTHDAVFEHQTLVRSGAVTRIAELAGLDVQRAADDMMESSIARRVREDFLSGVRSGVNGTPTFYINGLRYDGAWDHAHLLGALQQALVAV